MNAIQKLSLDLAAAERRQTTLRNRLFADRPDRRPRQDRPERASSAGPRPGRPAGRPR